MIVTFNDKRTEQTWLGYRNRKLPPDLHSRAISKLAVLNRAKSLNDRAAQHSLSINKQWRICFVWKDGNAHDVEIVDYH